MNTAIQAALDHAVQSLQAEGTLPSDWKNTSVLTRTKDRSHGDFASNIAMDRFTLAIFKEMKSPSYNPTKKVYW